MKKLLLGTAVAMLASSAAYAQDYQFEVGAAYINGDKPIADFDGFALNAQLHLDKVDTTKGPLNEAAFLDKSSFLNIGWATQKSDLPGASSNDTIGVSGRFVMQSDFIIEAAYVDLDGGESSYGIGFGMYLNEGIDAVLSYQTLDEADESSLSFDVHGVNKLTGDTAIAFDAGIAYLDVADESGYSISAGADYYLNNALSFGAGLGLASVNDTDVSTLSLRADYFVIPAVRLGASFTSYGQDADVDVIALSVVARF